MMKILIAPDSFKESLSAVSAAEAIARGVKRAKPQATVDLCPVADGGEGTVEALVSATGGERFVTEVSGPLGEPVDAVWGELGGSVRTAVIEAASAAGLALVPAERRDPTRTSSYGVGQLIKTALDYGNTTVIVGLGGSATCDGGAGCAQALGVWFFDHRREIIEQTLSGGLLERINYIDLSVTDRRIGEARLRVACDVTNPLIGPDGAARVYAAQKGATTEQVEQLEEALTHLAKTTFNAEPDRPGMGAAGGLGFGLTHFLGAELERGIELVLDVVDFDRRCDGADLVITGEGKLDGQTAQGKACAGVASRAARQGVKTIALVGDVSDGAEAVLKQGLSAWYALTDQGVGREQAMAHAAEHLEKLAERVMAEQAG